MRQSSIFEFMYDTYKITKPVRIIELFAGYGSQHLALSYLGADVKGHKIVEWAVPSIQAYKDLHYTDVNIDHTQELTDDEIVDALADYGIPQIRNRTFMISILGEYSYSFPKPIPLETKLSDYLEEEVDEKYFLSDKMMACFTDMTNRNGYVRGTKFNPHTEDSQYAFAITTNAGQRATDNFIIVPEKTKKVYAIAQLGDGVYINRPHQKRGVVQKGKIQTLKTSVDDIGVVVRDTRNLKEKLCDNLLKLPEIKPGDVVKRSYTSKISSGEKKAIEMNNIMPTMTTRLDTLGVVVNYKKNDIWQLRIRKITPLEAFRLMGVKDDDYDKIAKNQSNSSLYHLAGDSIVVNVLMAIFKQLL